MSSESTLILFGLLVVVTPYSGVPIFWYAYILPVLGIVIIGIGFLFRSRRVSSENNATQTLVRQSSHMQSSDNIAQRQGSDERGNDEVLAELPTSFPSSVTQETSSDTSGSADVSDGLSSERENHSPIS